MLINYASSPYFILNIGIDNEYYSYNFINNDTLKLNKDDLEMLSVFAEGKDYIESMFYLQHNTSIKKLIKNQLLIPTKKIWTEQYTEAVEIETTTFCNWICEYCPSSNHVRENKVMDMELFNYIIDSIADLTNVKYVTLHFYNEPTLDPYFLNRIKKIKSTNLKLMLFTNGTGLNKMVLERLFHYHVIDTIYFTLPSLDPDIFDKMTGTIKRLPHSISIIREAINIGFNIKVSVQGFKTHVKENKEKMIKYFNLEKENFNDWQTFDRAANLQTKKYRQNTEIKSERLHGCPHILKHLYIGVDGDLILCDQDYFKKNIYGNIKDGSIISILSSKKIIDIKKQIFGYNCAEKDLICRKCQRMEKAYATDRIKKKIISNK